MLFLSPMYNWRKMKFKTLLSFLNTHCKIPKYSSTLAQLFPRIKVTAALLWNPPEFWMDPDSECCLSSDLPNTVWRNSTAKKDDPVFQFLLCHREHNCSHQVTLEHTAGFARPYHYNIWDSRDVAKANNRNGSATEVFIILFNQRDFFFTSIPWAPC